MEHAPPRTWAEIDVSALRHNYRVAIAQSGGKKGMAVVKANAYGHDTTLVLDALEQESPDFYGVANVSEARKVQARLPRARIYLLGAANPLEYREIVERGLTPCASTMEELVTYAEIAASYRKATSIHLALDTGMGRGGFLPDTPAYAQALTFTHPYLQVEGIGSHLPVADEDEAFTQEQIRLFNTQSPTTFSYLHLENSAGILHYQNTHTNLVRPGLMLYGVSPIAHYQSLLKPVMTLKSRVSLIRDLPAGHGISYGRTFITARASRIATVGIGYADGIKRTLSNAGAQVWVKGRYAPILGRITMDQIMIDVTDIPECLIGDEVELFGRHILAAEVAERAGTIPWEIFTGVARRVERVAV